ncbi:MAG: hypothetical protein NVS2B3_12930 [Vulcanimicrobiaceae bacterium]
MSIIFGLLWRRRLARMSCIALLAIAVSATTVRSAIADQETAYPTPDFSAMEKWYKVVKWEYRVFDGVLNVVITPKVKSRPYLFEMRYVDEDGAVIRETSAGSYYFNDAEVGVPLKFGIFMPSETQMAKVKKVLVVRQKI